MTKSSMVSSCLVLENAHAMKLLLWSDVNWVDDVATYLATQYVTPTRYIKTQRSTRLADLSRLNIILHVPVLMLQIVLKSATAGLLIYWCRRCSGDQVSYLADHCV